MNREPLVTPTIANTPTIYPIVGETSIATALNFRVASILHIMISNRAAKRYSRWLGGSPILSTTRVAVQELGPGPLQSAS
ncbi:hypothetical protein BJX99DRAFT_217905 [Aspergillus californicus]